MFEISMRMSCIIQGMRSEDLQFEENVKERVTVVNLPPRLLLSHEHLIAGKEDEPGGRYGIDSNRFQLNHAASFYGIRLSQNGGHPPVQLVQFFIVVAYFVLRI